MCKMLVLHYESADFKVIGIQFMTVFVMRMDSACS